MEKDIAYITGTRSDFGLITPLLKEIEKDFAFSLHLYATGMHLHPTYGHTLQRVKTIFPHVKTVHAPINRADRAGTTLFGSALMKALTKEFLSNRPDLVIVHGDRIEALITAVTCRYLAIPTAHIHGGDRTTTVDDAARGAITNIASLHFPATIQGARRIARMGVDTRYIHVVGALGLDAVRTARLKPRVELLKSYNLPPHSKFLLVLQHPVSERVEGAADQMDCTITAVKAFGLPTIIVYPNGDPGSQAMIERILKEKKNPLFRITPSVDFDTFASLEKEAAVWIGNSSAAIVESTYFKTPVVNIGRRQEGRERSPNIIDVDDDESAIRKTIQKSLFDEHYRRTIRTMKSPWGDGRAVERIMRVLKHLKYETD